MGCETSSTAAPVLVAGSTAKVTDFAVTARQVKQTWPDVRKIDKLGAKTFAHLLHKYPELRSFYHIPQAYKTEADLLNAPEVKEAGDKFISLYSDIIENSDTRFNEVIHEKARQLYQQGIRASQVKFYGDSLVHVIKYELQHDFHADENQSWQLFSSQVSNSIASEFAKFPRRSIV